MIYPGRGPIGYVELADIVRALITSGQLKPGQRLPSEASLSQTYGVSIKTARAALRELRSEGLAVSVRGYGVVVREQFEPTRILLEAGDEVSARQPTPQEREDYQVPEGVPLIVVHHRDGLQDLYPAHLYRVATRSDSGS
ncbi:winged helix-turn-helix domain-containing protein [Micromonospora sp. NPDC000207]|uniref:winged helix-turn-helix domain-containing protein n=1 Tax=Micromonospora sp. NPDC000207 TaxID=3154246 RepID=UPI00332ADBC8